MSVKKELAFIAGKINKEELINENEVISYLRKKSMIKSRIFNMVNNLISEVDLVSKEIDGETPYYGRPEAPITPEEKNKLRKLCYKMLKRHLSEVEEAIEAAFAKEEEPEEVETEVVVVKKPIGVGFPEDNRNYNY